MKTQVLVTYATKHGSTAEIATKIGEVISEMGFVVDVLDVNQAVDLSNYTAVVVGSSIYFGDWHNKMVDFLELNQEILHEKDVWIFSSGPTGMRDEYELSLIHI